MTADTAHPETVTAVLECRHMIRIPVPVSLPDVAECPLCGYEREITGIFGEDGDLEDHDRTAGNGETGAQA
jgi:hypothetical protein